MTHKIKLVAVLKDDTRVPIFCDTDAAAEAVIKAMISSTPMIYLYEWNDGEYRKIDKYAQVVS